MTLSRSILWTAVTLVCAAEPVLGQAADSTTRARPAPTSFADALARGRERDTPVLLEFYTEW